MIGYKYITEEEAIAARKSAADYKGLPISPDSSTIYWVNYNYSEIDNFYYIVYIEDIELVLGDPTEFTVTPPPEEIN